MSRPRGGFTLIELLVVILIVGIVIGFAVPSIGRSMAQTRLQRAATVFASDLRQSLALAGRQRQPVQIHIDEEGLRYSVLNRGGAVLLTRGYSTALSQHPVQRMRLNSTANPVTVYPNGLTSGNIEVEITAAGGSRRIRMTRAGQVRID